MKTSGNIYGNGSRHVTQRVKLTKMLNWESLFISSWLSSYRSMNSSVGVNPHGSTEKVKLLLNDSHLETQAVKQQRHPRTMTWSSRSTSSRETPSPLPGASNVEVVFVTLPPVSLHVQPVVVLLLEGDLVSWSQAMDERSGHQSLRGSGRRSVIPYVHERTELYCSSLLV
jgi:hypothetical protein